MSSNPWGYIGDAAESTHFCIEFRSKCNLLIIGHDPIRIINSIKKHFKSTISPWRFLDINTNEWINNHNLQKWWDIGFEFIICWILVSEQ